MVEIKKVDSQEEALILNDMLKELIVDEHKFNENINPNVNVVDFYDKCYSYDNICLVCAKKKGIIVGYLYGYLENDVKNIKKSAKLDALYVCEDNRNNGIGQKLIDYFINWCKEKNITYLNVTSVSANDAALKLYEKNGFMEYSKNLRKKID